MAKLDAAKLDNYRNAVQEALLNYAEMRSGISSNPELELQVLFDTQRDLDKYFQDFIAQT